MLLVGFAKKACISPTCTRRILPELAAYQATVKEQKHMEPSLLPVGLAIACDCFCLNGYSRCFCLNSW